MIFKSINTTLLLKNFQGDEEILLDMIEAFQSGLHNLLSLIKESIEAENSDQLRINAHTFKGIMNSFYSDEASKFSYELEIMGQDSKFDGAMEVFNKLQDELIIFLNELQVLKKDLEQRS